MLILLCLEPARRTALIFHMCFLLGNDSLHSGAVPPRGQHVGRRDRQWGRGVVISLRARRVLCQSTLLLFTIGAARRGHSRGFQRARLCLIVLTRALRASFGPQGRKERKRAGNLFRTYTITCMSCTSTYTKQL